MEPNKENKMFKSVMLFDPLFLHNKKKSSLLLFDENDQKKKLAQSKHINPVEEEIKKIEKTLRLSKRNYNEITNVKLLYQIKEDLNVIKNILDDYNEELKDSSKITFLNVVSFILKKINKKTYETEILKTYFLNFEKLVHLFMPLNININDMMTRLVGQIQYEKKGKNRILFKEGDKGDKFYIILKGVVGILIPQEKIVNCCPTEFLKYLISLYLYQEKSLINKLLVSNRGTLKYDEKIFYSLMDGLKFYHFFIYYSGTKKSYKNPIEFLHKENKINNFIQKKTDFSPEQAFHSLNLTNISEEIYEYYHNSMNEMHSTFLTNLNENKVNPNTFSINSTNLSEFGEYIKEYEHDKRKLKENEFLDKLYRVSELSTNFTLGCSTEEYILRVNCERKIKDISKEIRNNIIKINEEPIDLKYYNYLEVNQLKDKNIFGELALINPNQKRTATIIIKEDCHFGILDKESYEISIKAAQEKSRIRNLLYFTNGFLFKGLTNNYFLNNYFFRFKKKTYNLGEYLFRRGEKRTKIFFIISGELQIGGKMTLKKITEIISYLDRETRWDDGGVIVKYCKKCEDFIKFYEEKENNFRFYVLKKKEIAGLDDMTENDIFLFDCMANSLEPTEVYEFDYKIFKTCLKERPVEINNDNYVAIKKNLLIDRLYKQRNSIANNEFKRIQRDISNQELINMKIKEKKDIKIDKNFLNLNKTIFKKDIHSLIEENKKCSNNLNSTITFDTKKPFLKTIKDLSYYEQDLKHKFLFSKNPYQDSNILTTPNRKSVFMPIESNDSPINNPNILLKLEKDKHKKEKEISNLLKSDNLNLNKIALYLNKSDLTFPQLEQNFKVGNDRKTIYVSKKVCNNNESEFIMNKTISNKSKFTFNNQKIFSLLLKHHNYDDTRNNLNTKDEEKTNKAYENNKENFINVKDEIINNELKNYENYIRNRRKKKFLVSQNNSREKRKYRKRDIEEDYQNIFLIDCLCLDKWEENNNKFHKKSKSEFKGKKITLNQ